MTAMLPHPEGVETVAGSWIGRSAPRLDGHRYVSGQVRYSADLLPAGCLHVALVRSPHAHARIVAVDAAAARGMPGVVAVVDGTEAERLCAPMPQVLPFRHPDAARLIIGRCLAADAARFAGQPVAAVVAGSQQDADAAADRIVVHYEPLHAVLHAEEALAKGAPVVHPGWTSNVVARDHVLAGDPHAAMEGANRVVRGTLSFRPSTAAPMETLCYAGDWDQRTGRLTLTGDVEVALGVTSPGNGNETGIAQLVGSVLGLAPEEIRVIQGDTDTVPVGTGNASSRAMLYGGAAAHLAATDLRAKLAICAGNVLQAEPGAITFADGQAWTSSGGGVGLRELALGAHTHPFTVGDGVELPLEATRSYRARNIQPVADESGRIATYSSFPYSVHAAAVELDLGTGRVTVLDYAVVHDCGVMVNPGLVSGQLKGAVAMGVGAALWEELLFDDDGRLQSDRLKTYLLPRTTDLPPIRVGHMETPSPFHPLGMKGAGESGLGGAMAAVFNAVADALGPATARLATVPATPQRLIAILARGAAP